MWHHFLFNGCFHDEVSQANLFPLSFLPVLVDLTASVGLPGSVL